MWALAAFMRHRFYPPVTVPYCSALYAGSCQGVGRSASSIVNGSVSLFLALLALRITDDLADLEVDRTHQPRRWLATGDADAVRAARLPICGTLVALSGLEASVARAFVLSVGFVFYTLYYAVWRRRLSPSARAVAVNVAFALIPLHACAALDAAALWLSAFCWSAMVAHDFLHDVHAPHERAPGYPSLSGALGARPATVIGVAVSVLGAGFGVLAWRALGRSAAFGAALALVELLTLLLAARLLACPSTRRARPLYVVAALVPLLPLGVVGVFGRG